MPAHESREATTDHRAARDRRSHQGPGPQAGAAGSRRSAKAERQRSGHPISGSNGSPDPQLACVAGRIACLADARPIAATHELFASAGFGASMVEHHDQVLSDTIDHVHASLRALNIVAPRAGPRCPPPRHHPGGQIAPRGRSGRGRLLPHACRPRPVAHLVHRAGQRATLVPTPPGCCTT